MPLILLSGYPSSGKTHRAQQLLSDFTARIASSSDPRHSRFTVFHINDQSLGLSRDVYREAKTEKDARATAYSAVKRALGRECIVLCDGLNYIKGFRYQMYCEAKAVGTGSCVVRSSLFMRECEWSGTIVTGKGHVEEPRTAKEVHVGTPIHTCREINTRLLADSAVDGGYTEDLFENLVFRYEEPNGMTRWDSPLFTVLHEDELPPFETIWEAMVGSDGKAKVVKPNLATILTPATDSDYLYELDKMTQETLQIIFTWQKDHPGEGGGNIKLAEGTVELPASPLSLPQLQRLRRQYISLNRHHTLAKDRIRDNFVAYLNNNFR
ncbi:hypothetical protein MMC11_001740 [Xylographa trunciseda]|nr:hypothetical protein [Xylographa trunciseda]